CGTPPRVNSPGCPNWYVALRRRSDDQMPGLTPSDDPINFRALPTAAMAKAACHHSKAGGGRYHSNATFSARRYELLPILAMFHRTCRGSFIPRRLPPPRFCYGTRRRLGDRRRRILSSVAWKLAAVMVPAKAAEVW